jgi:predicted ATPase
MRHRHLSFGPFRFDPLERQLSKGRDRITLSPKPLALLTYLLQHPGRLMTKQELLEAIWPGVHVGEAVLKTCVAEIRQALNDDAAMPRFIETVQRLGYRFVAPLQSNNLPDRATRFIGRERELNDVKSLLRTSNLVTLLGAGGVGKSSLAIRVATDLLSEMPHGVCWVDLAPLFSPDQIALSVAAGFGIRDHVGLPILEPLVDFLEHAQLLLVLDNCEHLVDACAAFVQELSPCRGVRVLTTSREALGVDREVAWRVPPLSVPDVSAPAASVMASEAVQLFVDRATRTSASFDLRGNNVGAIAEICRRLDGLPLAVEIAAARVKVLSPEEILSRLDDALVLLGTDTRTRGSRHQTLTKALDWSFEMLTNKECLALAILSVFAGDFTLGAAEALCVGSGEIDTADVLDLITRLVDKSMITVADRAPLTEKRFQLLQIIRQYARKRLPENVEARVLAQHAAFFGQLTEDLRHLMTSSRREESLARLEREYANVAAAFDWSLNNCQMQIAIRIAGAIWPYWLQRGNVREGVNWLNRALAGDRSGPADIVARALTGAGALAHAQGNPTTAVAYLEQSIELCRATNNVEQLGHALFEFAHVAYRNGDIERSNSALDESIAILRCGEPNWHLARALSESGLHAMYEGRFDDAAALQEEAAAIMQSTHDLFGLTMPLRNLALVYAYQSQYDRAEAYCREALVILRGMNERWMVAFTVEILGSIWCLRKRYTAAAQLLGAAERLRETVGTQSPKLRRTDYDRLLLTLRSALTEDEFQTWWASGRTLTRDDAIATALATTTTNVI